MRLSRLLALTASLLLFTAAQASADLTFFAGTASGPSTRATRGAALGVSFLVVGAEFEYASTVEDAAAAAPSLKTGMVNGFVQTPFAIARLRPYFTVGGGGYRERLGTQQETNVVVNTGGGVKISLVGPLRARVDYRLLTLKGSPIESRVHRFYAGANLSF
jgi:hypothetical protein